MEFLATEWMGKPAWMWAGFLVVVVALLAFDLGVLHRKAHEIGVRESLLLSGFYIAVALAFGVWVWVRLGADSGLDYLTGFAIEKSLAMDNVFVIAMIFSAFGIPRLYQHRVLFWGVLGVIMLRAVMIAAGAALVSRYEWVLYVFAAFLIFTGGRMMATSPAEEAATGQGLVNWLRRHMPVTDQLHGSRFFVREKNSAGRMIWHATVLVDRGGDGWVRPAAGGSSIADHGRLVRRGVGAVSRGQRGRGDLRLHHRQRLLESGQPPAALDNAGPDDRVRNPVRLPLWFSVGGARPDRYRGRRHDPDGNQRGLVRAGAPASSDRGGGQ